ncbi:Serine/threonine-protein kinase SAPK3 [Coccomyxa sp. Obi]|nr:Serine/threonine-protein kinase SAPK3 [Coccomyxa sp. Obi]
MGNCNCAHAETKEDRIPTGGPAGVKKIGGDAKPTGAPFSYLESHRAIKHLGRGAAADTWLFVDRKRNRLVAIKLFPRPIPANLRDSTLNEVKCQTELGPGHINLINVYEAILTPDHLGIVMEYATGGALTAHVAERWGAAKPGGLILSEDEARYFFRQFIEAVDYCHRNKIAHRDLKLDNTLLDNQNPPFIKICDFGFARHLNANNLYRTKSHLGTPEYMSPELLRNQSKDKTLKEYDPRSVDVWASGVLLLVSLCGAFPWDHTRQHDNFNDDQELDLWLQEVNKQWSESPFIADNVNQLSPEARDLLDRIFVLDPTKRITIPEIMRHAWYTKALRPEHQAALDRVHEEQRQVDEHLRHRKLDPVKVAERNKRLEQLVDEACSAEALQDISSHGRQLRPLHVLDFKHREIKRLDLTERAVLEGESCNCTEEHATVADRAAGLEMARSGKLHESASMKSFESSNGNGADKSRE